MHMQNAVQREKNVYNSPGSKSNSYLSGQKLSWCVHSKVWKELTARSSAFAASVLQNKHLLTLHVNTLWAQDLE